MRTLALLLLAASSPALAQHQGHQMPAQAPPAEAKPAPANPHAGHEMTPAPASDPHAGHVMSSPAAPAPADPHAGHTMSPAPPEPADPHAGHDMSTMTPAAPADPHAGHDMGAMAAEAPPVAPPPPEALSGPEHAADAVYGTGSMDLAREELRVEHGSMTASRVLIDQLEWKIQDGRDGYAWEGQAWYGGDINKLWVKSQGEGTFGEGLKSAEVQALWSRAVNPWFDVQLGLRHDFRPDPDRTYLALGIEGLSPYWFEIDAAAFVSEKGDVSARLEAEHDLRLTQKLILQPLIQVDLAAQDVPELGIGAGLSTGEAGLRLRYEIKREFAPYVGVEYQRAFGDTARF
ncbi:MAG: copper resistance protein B, partial [Allosphingosinicella sp.]